MPKLNGGSPTTVDNSDTKKILINIPDYRCGAMLSLFHVGAAGVIFFKTGCGPDDKCSDTDYEDKLVVGEIRYIDNPPPGRVFVYCNVTPNAQNIAWHASTRD